MIYAATGHRPEKVGGYEREATERLELFAFEVLAGIQRGPEAQRISRMISGMALGWDTAVALAALELKIPLEAAVPFKGQEEKWPEPAKRRYHDILRRCIRVNYLAPPGFQAWKMGNRNFWMVNKSERMLALWNGTKGGTEVCVGMANKEGREVVNLWERWQRFADTNPTGRLKPRQASPAWRSEQS